nr:MAG TPA: hypothetical protein [Bacteriophage sp.]
MWYTISNPKRGGRLIASALGSYAFSCLITVQAVCRLFELSTRLS